MVDGVGKSKCKDVLLENRLESLSYTTVGRCWGHRAWTEVRVQQKLMCGRGLQGAVGAG